MKKGFNKANIYDKLEWIFESADVKKRPCVFLSHKREDKAECRKIAEYLKQAEIIDIGVENKWNFSWTIINLTNHENMFYYFYDTNKNPPQFEAIYQFPFLPVMLNYEYYF